MAAKRRIVLAVSGRRQGASPAGSVKRGGIALLYPGRSSSFQIRCGRYPMPRHLAFAAFPYSGCLDTLRLAGDGTPEGEGTMNALAAAAESILLGCCADLRAAVEGLDDPALAWQPAAEASSLAQLVRHGVTATGYLLGGAATGHANRTRYLADERTPSFTGGTGSASGLIALLGALESRIPAILAGVSGDRLAESVQVQGGEGEPPTRAWMLLHACDHLREHVGHAQLTRQLLEQQGAGRG